MLLVLFKSEFVDNKDAEAMHKQLLRSFGHSNPTPQENDKSITCVETLTNLFENLANMIHEVQYNNI